MLEILSVILRIFLVVQWCNLTLSDIVNKMAKVINAFHDSKNERDFPMDLVGNAILHKEMSLGSLKDKSVVY